MTNYTTQITATSGTNVSYIFPSAIELLMLRNIGTVNTYFNLNGSATINQFPLIPGDTIQLGLSGCGSIFTITNSGTSIISIMGANTW